MKKPKKEQKNEIVQMDDYEKSMISNWKKIDQTLSPLKCTQKEDGFLLETLSGKGSHQEKKDLVHAGVCLATGAKSSIFGTMLINSCLSAGGLRIDEMKKSEAEQVLGSILDTLHSLKPSDEIEGMLVTRLISLNFLISKSLNLSVMENQSLEGQEIYTNRSSKLMRLFNETLDALMRYRRKGEQKVVVQHVNVNDGGRAIVGNFDASGGGGGR